MNRKMIFTYLIIIVALTYTSYLLTYSFFSDVAHSNSNIFAAASLFPTPTPTATPSPSPTPTPSTSPTPSPSPSPSPTAPPLAQTLVINEFVWDTTCGNNNQESNYWIELFNGSSSQIELQNWRLRDANSNTIQISNSSKTVNPGQFVILSKDGSVFSGNNPCFTLQDSPVTANLGGNQDFLPATTGGVITLEQPNGQTFDIIDRVEYGPTLNSGALNAAKDQSIARIPNGLDSALGNTFNSTDFKIDTTSTPGVTNAL